MRSVFAVCVAAGGLLAGCGGSDGSGSRTPAANPPAAASKPKAVSEVLIKYCSS